MHLISLLCSLYMAKFNSPHVCKILWHFTRTFTVSEDKYNIQGLKYIFVWNFSTRYPLKYILNTPNRIAFMCRRKSTRIKILAHRITISEILLWDRKSYLTHAVLPRLSREGYIHCLYRNSRTLSSSDVIVVLK